MTPQQIAAIIIKTLAIFLVFQLLFFIEFNGIKLTELAADGGLMMKIIFIIFFLIIFVFWFFPMTVANHFIPNTKLQNKIDLQTYQAVFVVCVALGLWTVVMKALLSIIIWVTVAVIVLKQGLPITEVPLTKNLELLQGIFYLMTGIFLIYKASYISKEITALSINP